MIIFVILLVLFGLSIQLVFLNTHKRNIIKRDYNALNVVLYMDALATILFIFSVHFNAPIFVKVIFEAIIFLMMGLFFLVVMGILKTSHKRYVIYGVLCSTLLIVLGVILFHSYIDKNVTHGLLLMTLVIRLLIVNPKKNYASKSIRSIYILLFITETARYTTEAFILSDVLYHDFSDTWISAFSFILKALSMLLLIRLHDQISMNSGLAKILDYQSSAMLLNQYLKQSPNVIVITNLNHEIVYVNPQATVTTGYSPEELIGKKPNIFKSGQTPQETYDDLIKSLSKGESWIGEFYNRKKNGDIFIEQSKIMTLNDENGVPVFHLAIKNDITKEKEYLKQLEYRSYHDDLTGLLRRQVFIQRFETGVQVKPEINHFFILMDVDDFKQINDSYGHLIGDQVLIDFSKVLNDIFYVKAQVCRFGGDEFAVYLYDYEPEDVLKLIETLENRLRKTPIFTISDHFILKFSYGLVKVDLPFEFSKTYELADNKLYSDKGNKNQSI